MTAKKKNQKLMDSQSTGQTDVQENVVVEVQPEQVTEITQEQPTSLAIEEPVTPTPEPEQSVESMLKHLMEELSLVKEATHDNSNILNQLQHFVVTKRKAPVSNGKVQIKDTKTGVVYPSKNNVYQSLLKSGELNDLITKGTFGKDPEKNSFGCYTLFRQFPGRFEEIKVESE